MKPHSLVVSLACLLLLGCGATSAGILGKGETVERPPKMAVAGLTLAEKELLDRGPGRLGRGALVEMAPDDADTSVQLDLPPLNRSGLLGALMRLLPASARAKHDQLQADTGVDIAKDVGTVVVTQRGSSEEAYLAASFPTLRLHRVVGFLEKLNKILNADKTDPKERGGFLIVLAAEHRPEDVLALRKVLWEKDESPERLLLANGHVLSVFEKDGRMLWTYVWAHGLVVGRVASFSGKLMEAAAQRAHAAVKRLVEASRTSPGAGVSIPTVALDRSAGDPSFSVRMTVGTTTSVEAHVASASLPQGLVQMLEQWETGRDQLVTLLEGGGGPPILQGRDRLRELFIEALKATEITGGDPIECRLEVDTSTLVEGLGELPSP